MSSSTSETHSKPTNPLTPVFTNLALTPSECQWLESKCPWFSKSYLDYLSSFRFKPDQVSITFIPTSTGTPTGQVEIEATGPWAETILWEVPLMATLSETYFQIDNTDWNYDGQSGIHIHPLISPARELITWALELAFHKGKTLLEAGCSLSEFGTRRRRSFHTQDLVLQALIRASQEHSSNTHSRLVGTSNVNFPVFAPFNFTISSEVCAGPSDPKIQPRPNRHHSPVSTCTQSQRYHQTDRRL